MRALLCVIGLTIGLTGCTNAQLKSVAHTTICGFLIPCPSQGQRSLVNDQFAEMRPAAIPPEIAAAQARDAAAERAREQANDQAEQTWRQKPQWATIKPMSLFTEAPVCATYDDVRLMLNIMQDYLSTQMAYKLGGPQFILLHGPAPSRPIPEAFSCSLLPAGTRVSVNMGNVVPVVSAKFKGRFITGVMVMPFLQFDNVPPGWHQ